MPLFSKETKTLSETTMEIEGGDGTKLSLKPGVKSVFGRGTGFNTDDLTVSRRHVSFELKPFAGGTERSESDRVCFEVLGRNPVWVRTGQPGDKIQTFRNSETGEIAAGERFCLSGHLPVWFTLKRRDEATEERVSDGESRFDIIDISDIDPVKEFGFLVIGKEFDQYPNSRIRNIKQWEWFLEDSTNGNDDDDDGDDDGDRKGRKGLSKKRRRKKGNEDDDWSVESEEDKELLVKSKNFKTPTYSTRSKKTKKDPHASSSSRSQTKQRVRVDVEEEEDDETLGGFIVSDEEAKLEEEDGPNLDDDEEEEEDFDEEEDEE